MVTTSEVAVSTLNEAKSPIEERSSGQNSPRFVDLHPFAAYRHLVALFNQIDDEMTIPEVPSAIVCVRKPLQIFEQSVISLYCIALDLGAEAPDLEYLNGLIAGTTSHQNYQVLSDFVLPFRFPSNSPKAFADFAQVIHSVVCESTRVSISRLGLYRAGYLLGESNSIICVDEKIFFE